MNDQRYKLERILASTPYSLSALVMDQWTGKHYFTKTLYLSSASAIHLHQFKMEIQVLSLMNDPYMPHLIDVIQDDEKMMIIETWIPGKTLLQKKKEKKLFRFKKRWVLELMHLLENLHAQGFLYLDLKLDNMMIYQNHLFLIDFNACLPIGSVQVYMSSQSNRTPESLTSRKKEVTSDIYALGTLLRPFHTMSLYRLWIFKCMKQDVQKRFSTIRSARFYYLLIGYIQKGMCLLLLILSVFFYNTISFQSRREDLIRDYQFYQYQIEGGLQEKTQKVLSEWIVQNRLNIEVLSDEENASFFLEQAIFSRSQSIVSYILKCMPDSMQKKLPLQVQLANWIVFQSADDSLSLMMDSLQAILKESDALRKALHISVLEQMLLENEVLLDKKARLLLDEIHKTWTNDLVQENKEIFKEVACTHLEYLLLLRSRNIEECYLPTVFIETFQDEETFIQLLDLLN